MDTEVIRAVADWLADATYGVNAKLAGVPRDVGYPLVRWTTVGDTDWTSLTTRVAAASMVAGFPLDRISDASTGNQTYTTRALTLAGTGDGDKYITFLVRRVSVYGAHQVVISDNTAGVDRLNININYLAAAPIVSVLAGLGTVVSVVATDDGYRLTCKLVGVLAANVNQFQLIPAGGPASDTASIDIGDIRVHNTLPAEPDDPPTPMAAILDETRNSFIALKRIPDEQPMPALLVYSPEDVTFRAVNQTRQLVDQFPVTIAYVVRAKDADRGVVEGSYALRAVRRSLNAFHAGAAVDLFARTRNGIEIRNGNIRMSRVKPDLQIESAVTIGGIRVTYDVWDNQP